MDGTSVKVAVRIRPLATDDVFDEAQLCINTIPGVPQIIAGTDAFFTFDHVFGVDSSQSLIYEECVVELVNAAFEGFNATILAYGQTGSGKTWTMGSGSTDMLMNRENFGIIPRAIEYIFNTIQVKEEEDPHSTYKVHVQFLEIYGEDIKDLLDHTKTSKVTIRESAEGDVFVSGAREEAISSTSQMMRALDDGSRHRTTGSTLMNSSSSRSHAIFTIFLEHTIDHSLLAGACSDTIQEEIIENDDIDGSTPDRFEQPATRAKEVRRCKFHFVDLAGSERAKRTGAQGQQMKEGIDINKGLLALGNVISALGDEQRRGKVHVPYRVSKLTRMLQDSLGGNSKTLMICCVSPSDVNFHESLNALRYANRARNIKNKPIVNRDPTLVLITELKELVHVLATELVDVRKNVSVIAPESAMSLQELESILLNKSEFRSKLGSISGTPQWTPMCSPRGSVMRPLRGDQDGESPYSNNRMSLRRDDSEPSFMTSRTSMIRQDVESSSASNRLSTRMSVTMGSYMKEHPSVSKKDFSKEVASLKSRAVDSDAELKRLTDKLKEAKQQASNQAERLIMVESERDFFRMKWSDLSPVEAGSLQPTLTPIGGLFAQVEDKKLDRDIEAVSGEKEAATRMAIEYLREIRALKAELAEQKLLSVPSVIPMYSASDSMLESELATNVARVIAQTEKHLKLEARRLRSIGVDASAESAVGNVLSSLDEGNDSDGSGEFNRNSDNPLAASGRPTGNADSQIEVDDLAYQRRQKGMIEEVAELGESIELKEQLLGQLRRSHHQYGVMKAFYEQKLDALNSVMEEKQEERERLMEELSFIEKDTTTKDKLQSDQENRLRLQLQKKDDELRLLKKRQEELCNLSKVQARYTSQVSKLESDIDNMKKQKVDLSKSLQAEKKKHFISLNEKAREIDKLKKELMVSAGEARKLGKDKQRAEEKVKEAMKTTAVMRKKIHDSQRLQSTEAARGRSASVRMNSRSPRNNIKILSEEDLNTKKWLDIKIADINAREDAVDTLRKQFEQQLALLNRKETLERERTTMKSMRSVVTCQSKSQLNAEEEEAMQEIEDRIESVEGQLKLRNRNITEIQSKLGGDGTGQEVTVEALRSSIGSLPAAQELITLLFDMLVNSKATAKQRKTALVRVEGKEKQLRIDLDDAGKRMNALIRAHDMELTRSANEYEDKMLGLFSHSTIGQIVRMESEMRPTDSTDSAINILANLSMEEPGAFSAQNSFSVAGRHSLHNESANKIIVAASNEHSNLLKAKLDRESRRNAELQIQISELTHGTLRFHQEIEEKNVLIKFLEDERTLFRDMADRMRAGISVLGGTAGEAILSQLKEDNDSDEDCEGFKGEFTNLGDIIHRNGSVNERSTPTSTTAPGVSTAASRDVVYDRLTNPSNFTGAMKNAFGDDLLKKRQQVQMIKSSHPPKRINASHTRTDSIRINKDMVPILSEINAVPSSDSSPGTTVPASPRRSQTPQRTKDTLSAEMKFPVVIPPITLKETTNVKLNKHHTLSSSTLSSASSHYSSDESSANSSYASLKCDPSPPEVPTGSPRGSPITDQLKRNGSGSLTKHFETPNLQETQFIVQKEMVVDANEVDANEVDIDVEVEDIEDADVDIDVLESILPYILNEFPPTADPEQDQVIPLTVAVKSHIKGDESTPPSTPSPIVHKDIIKVAEFEKNDKIIPTPSSPRSEEADYESAISNVPPSNDSSPNTKRGIGGMMRKLWGKKKSFMGSPETDVTTSDIENGSSGKKGSLFQN